MLSSGSVVPSCQGPGGRALTMTGRRSQAEGTGAGGDRARGEAESKSQDGDGEGAIPASVAPGIRPVTPPADVADSERD